MMVVLSEFSEGSSPMYDNNHRPYDVFLSCRGSDTRNNFTDHLYKALAHANLNTFLDDEDMETGLLHLKPELESAIKASKVYVIVLSKNYAFSTWCLDELVLILDQHKKSKHLVIPVFYHVEATHVREQKSSFGDAMEKHKQRLQGESNPEERRRWIQKMELWKTALVQVANLTRKDVNGRLEAEFIEEIITDIRHQLSLPIRSTFPDLIGVEHPVHLITSWLEDESTHSADILTIYGMGGIGKTTLSKYVFTLQHSIFHSSSFIDDINRKCGKQYDKLLGLHKQLWDDISETSSVQTQDVSVYTSKIENAVTSKKFFIVLDDVDTVDQLNAILGNKVFPPGSKIIITTRDASLKVSSYQECNPSVQAKLSTYSVKGLNEASSLKLLYFHAFNTISPKEAYKLRASKKLAKFCEGNPLALKVLGRSLRDQDVAEWEERVEGFVTDTTDSRIEKALRMSFDSLPSQNDKELFLHIACFFVGMDRDYTETILKACGIRTVLGIRNLLDRCLLTIGPGNKLMMHQLLQDMGRDVVRQESDKPWKRSRLWGHEESLTALKQRKGTGMIKGLTFDMRFLVKEKLHGSLVLKTDTLCKMDNLMLLQLNYVQLKGSYKNFPQQLRWLCMHQFPSKFVPSELPMEYLVALDLSHSNFESFDLSYNYNLEQPSKRRKVLGLFSKDKGLLGSLKILNLSYCYRLCSVGGFSQFPTLERLILTSCTSLIEISESIGLCIELVLIDLTNCYNLNKLPRCIHTLKKLKSLVLDGCNSNKSQMEALSRDLKFLTISLPRSLVRLSLGNSNLSNESFPMDFSSLSMLKDLQLDSNPIVSLPSVLRSLPRLEILSLKHCKMLKSIEHPPSTLRQLILRPFSRSYNYKHLLQKIAFDPKMSPLSLSMPLYLLAPSSIEIEGMVKIQPMAGVDETILRSLGWTNLKFIKKRRLGTYNLFRGSEESKIQMYYEFGIFSTIYGGKEMPNWISHGNKGPSISFTIPSSPNQLRGLNFCYVLTPNGKFPFPSDLLFHLPLITISNMSKNHTWKYQHYIGSVSVGGKYLTLLSHWMFGMNEMEAGDQITVTVTEVESHHTMECGVSFVYDDGKMEEKDVLGYYKSWNHILGGDLSAFQLTTGEYMLNNLRFTSSYYHPNIAYGASYKEEEVCFRAFSQRKTDMNLTPKSYSYNTNKGHTQGNMFSSKFFVQDVTK